MAYLYVLTFSNGKKYIGITTNSIAYRFRQHKTESRSGGNRALYSAWRKYGEPSMHVLAEVEKEDLAETEIRAISVFNTVAPNGYNISFGGEMSPMKNPDVVAKVVASRKKGAGYKQLVGRKMPEGFCTAASKRMLGKKLSPETKAKITAINRARALIPQSKETIEKRNAAVAAWRNTPEGIASIRAAAEKRVGKKQTQHARDVASATHKGKVLSEETKRKVSESQKIRLSDPKARRLLSEAARAFHTGKKRSDEAKANMALAQQLRRAKERTL